MKPSGIKYFLYARKSSENEDRQIASISSQIDELKRLATQANLTIEAVLTEEKSAKAPGRPIFNKMIEAIHVDKAQGIICWKLDRLARNPVDGGTISWMLQQSLIKHIQTFQRSYYPTDNVLMMNLEFGMANQFILDLSVNTKRGQRAKIEQGWVPHKPPIGYLSNKHNLPDLLPIHNDPERFELVKRLWLTLIEQRCSAESLYSRADDFGLRTPKGKPLTRSKFYTLFRNPFYYGQFSWNGTLYPGKHEPMISKTQFDIVQGLLDGRRPEALTRHIFAFTRLIRCGECGASITAEEKTKHQKNGNTHHYTYYRCSKRIVPTCSQKPIRDSELELQIKETLDKITIPPEFHQWAIKYLKEEQGQERNDRDDILKNHRSRADACQRKIEALFEMRLDAEISPEDFRARREKLAEEKKRSEEILSDANHRAETWINQAEGLLSFAETARRRFETGDLAVKREILSCLGLNLVLTDRTLEIQMQKPLALFQEFAPEVQALHKRLEPRKTLRAQGDYEVLYARNAKWGE
ncbi:MAG: recombinase family protein [Elusimicrobia bacterium]|nr:recombinase family protein [Elusimicrobiota bacterium]